MLEAEQIPSLPSMPPAIGKWEGGPYEVGSPFDLLKWKISHFILQAT